MADAAAVPAEAPNEGAWGVFKKVIQQMFMFYMISSVMKSFTGGGGFGPAGNSTASSSSSVFAPASNEFQYGQVYDVYAYLHESADRFKDFENGHLIVKKLGLVYGDWTSGENKDGTFTEFVEFPTPTALLKNQSVYLHTFVVRDGLSPDPSSVKFAKEVLYKSFQLNKYRKKYFTKTTNLLTGETEQSEEDQKKAELMDFEVLNCWHPNITINIFTDQNKYAKGATPPPLNTDLEFTPSATGYYPIIFHNAYWNLVRDYYPVNETVKVLNMSVSIQPLSIFKYQFYASQTTKQPQWTQMIQGDFNEEDQDMIKTTFLETNPYLLAITGLVSIAHTVLEMLAFKNDIQFWNSRKDLVGLSVRSVLFNIFQSLIVFLYVCDNDTNLMVKFSVGVGLLIECWKIPKVLDVQIDRENKIFGFIPRVHFNDKGSYVESETKVYDEMAFKYLSWVLFPLLVGYAVYSVIYVEQKGWYSWVLNMLYGYLLMFGFITMTPQLFINYKLKSVAHLPWRMLTYKFVNTFIDDLFAFVIKMPWLYRIGCFRDDIIFLVYVYQRWIYRVDPSRLNEFGTSLDHENRQDPAIEAKQEESSGSSSESEAEKETKKDK